MLLGVLGVSKGVQQSIFCDVRLLDAVFVARDVVVVAVVSIREEPALVDAAAAADFFAIARV